MLTTSCIDQITSISKRIAPDGGLHNPCLGDRMVAGSYLQACITTNELSSVGAFVKQFSWQLEQFTGAEHVVPVVNGTAALSLALRAVGVVRGDVVVTQPLTFIGTCNAIAALGAVPVFCDVDRKTGCMDVNSLRQILDAGTVRAVVPVHVQGLPGQMLSIVHLCGQHGIPVVEDAAEALGSRWSDGRHCGTMGRAGILSFNGNKTITTGAGGAALTNDDRLAQWMTHVSTQAKKPHRWEYEHDELAYNLRMPNICAALGCAQLDCIEQILDRKAQNYEAYREVFDSAGCDYLHPVGGAVWNHWLCTLLAADVSDRDRLLAEFNDRGIQARPLWKPLNEFGPYRACKSMPTPNARWLYERAVALPSGAWGIGGAQ